MGVSELGYPKIDPRLIEKGGWRSVDGQGLNQEVGLNASDYGDTYSRRSHVKSSSATRYEQLETDGHGGFISLKTTVIYPDGRQLVVSVKNEPNGRRRSEAISGGKLRIFRR